MRCDKKDDGRGVTRFGGGRMTDGGGAKLVVSGLISRWENGRKLMDETALERIQAQSAS